MKPYRREVMPFLSFPLFTEALINGYEIMLLSTSLSCQGFKWALGMGLFPVHYFMIDKLLLMCGSVKYAATVFESMVKGKRQRESHEKITDNINRYLCKKLRERTY